MAQRQVDLSAYIPPGVSSSGTGQGSLTRGQLIVDIEFDDNDDHFGTTPAAPPPTPQKATPAARPPTPAAPPTPQKATPAARPPTPAPQQQGLKSQTIAPQPGVSSVTVQGTGRQVPTNIRYAKPSKFVSVQARRPSNK